MSSWVLGDIKVNFNVAKDFRLNPEKGSRFIATGVSESGHDTKVRIWEAVAEDKSKTPDPDKASETTDEVCSHPNIPRWR
jgi:hypothetical protein